MQAHRLAGYFPLLEGEEFDQLVEDIKSHGQMEPIVTINGEILDGVNRYRACQQLGIEPLTKEYSNGDPISYVISMNVRRRHLSVSQKAMIATEMLPEFREVIGKPRPGDHARKRARLPEAETATGETRATLQAAKAFGVGRRAVEYAERVKRDAPDKVEAIIKGETTVSAVDAELRLKRAEVAAKERGDHQDTKTVKKQPKIVKEYFDALHSYREVLRRSLLSAVKAGMFSAPETKQMMRTRHNELRSLMTELEESHE